MPAISVQRLIGTLAFLDVIYQHVHRILKSRQIKDWCAQSWSIVVQFGTTQVYFFKWNNSYETGSMTGILEQLKWESLGKGER